MRKYHFTTALAATCALLCSTSMFAQSNQDQRDQQNRSQQQRQQQDQDSRDRDQQRQDQQRQDQQRQDQQSQQHQSRKQSGDFKTYIVPEGWVRIGIDKNNDGRVDVWQTIYSYDLISANKRSQDRQQQSGKQGNQSQSQNRVQISGEIQNLKEIELRHQGDQKFVIAHLNRNQGTTDKVLLGSVQKLEELDLQDGDRIRVEGRRGRVNDRDMVIATRVQSGDQSINVSPKSDGIERDTRKVKGDIENLKKRQFKNQDEQYVVADINLQGTSRPIVLGPESKVQDLDLQSGDEISALVCKGTMNGETALIATEIHANGNTADIAKDELVNIKKKEQQNQNQSRQRSQAQNENRRN